MKTEKIKVEVTKPVVSMIDRLVQTGLFGLNREDCAERLICRGLNESRFLIEERKLPAVKG
jgi:hypothetical protein